MIGVKIWVQACFEGNYKIAELLLEAGAERSNQNRWKKTPLEEAFSTGRVEMMHLICSEEEKRGEI